MVNHAPEGPPSQTILSHTHEGLSSPQPGITSSSISHCHQSEAAHVPKQNPAVCQDISPVDYQHDLSETTSDLDAYPVRFDFYHPDFLDNFELYPNTELEQAWANDVLAHPGGLSPLLTQFGTTKRTIASSPPPDSSHKRRKDDHEASRPPNREQQAPSGHDQSAEGLTVTREGSEAVYKVLQSPKPLPITPAMADEVQKLKRSFPCAFREAQSKLGLPYTCTAAPVSTVSAGRTHMTRKLPNKQPPHLPFLRLCKTCNEDILDEHEFNTFHGVDGLKCDNPKPQRKGNAGQQAQYDILCSKVEAYIIRQRNLGETITSAPAVNGSTLSRPDLPTSDSVVLPQLCEPTQAREEATKEHSRRSPLSKPPQRSYMARENLDEGWPISQSSLHTDTLMADLPSTALPESNSYLSPEDCDAAWPSRDKRTRHLPDPSMLGWQSLGEEASQSSKDRENVQRQVYVDYMDLDHHALDSTYGSQESSLLQPYIFSKVDLTPTRQTYANQSAEYHPKRTIPWSKGLALLSIIPGSGASSVTRSSDSVSLGPQTSYSRASNSIVSAPLRSSDSVWHGPQTSGFCPWGRLTSEITTGLSTETSAQYGGTFYCSERGCRARFEGSYAKGSLARHRRLKHGSHQDKDGREYSCEDPGCGKSYKRQDARLKHYRKAHPHLAPGQALFRTKYRSV